MEYTQRSFCEQYISSILKTNQQMSTGVVQQKVIHHLIEWMTMTTCSPHPSQFVLFLPKSNKSCIRGQISCHGIKIDVYRQPLIRFHRNPLYNNHWWKYTCQSITILGFSCRIPLNMRRMWCCMTRDLSLDSNSVISWYALCVYWLN